MYVHTHTHTHTMEYYSAIKKNKIMPFATIWMKLEIIIPSKLSQKGKTNTIWYHYMWNLKYDTNELIYETETDSQTLRTAYSGQEGIEKDRLDVWD